MRAFTGHPHVRAGAAPRPAAPRLSAPPRQSGQLRAPSVARTDTAGASLEQGPEPAAAPQAGASQCPFAHSAGLSSLTSASSNLLKQTPAAAEPGGAADELPRGSDWAALSPGEGAGLPRVEGRFCWNPLLGEVLDVEAQGAGPFLLQRYKEFGPVFSWRMGGQEVVSLLDYETIRSLLAADGRVLRGWNPEAMYAMLGEATRDSMEQPATRLAVRKLLAPGFSSGALSGYLGKMVDIVLSQLDEWAAAGSIDLGRQAKALSFEFSTQLLVNFAVPPGRKAALRASFDELFNGMIAPALRLPGTRFSRGLAARRRLLDEVKGLLAGAARSPPGPKASVFEHMLESRKYLLDKEELDDEDVAASGIGLVIAGNDTSGLGITGLLGLLPLLPHVMERLREEQQQLVAAHGPSLSRAVLEGMPYADAVIKEVLRFTPPAASVFRKSLVDLQIGGKFVPAGSILHMSFFVAQLLTDPGLAGAAAAASSSSSSASGGVEALASQQRLLTGQLPADYFRLITPATLAQQFRPERWLAPAAGSSAAAPESQHAAGEALGRPSGLLTFGSGPHVCLGQGLFMMEARVLLALLARHYSLALDEPDAFSVRMGFIPQVAPGTRLRVARLAHA